MSIDKVGYLKSQESQGLCVFFNISGFYAIITVKRILGKILTTTCQGVISFTHHFNPAGLTNQQDFFIFKNPLPTVKNKNFTTHLTLIPLTTLDKRYTFIVYQYIFIDLHKSSW